MAPARRSTVGLFVSSLLLAGCSSTASYGTHRLKHEWSLFGICGPYSRTWLEDGSGTTVLSGIEKRSVSPNRKWIALFDMPSSNTFHLLDVPRDVLRTVQVKGCVNE